MKLSPENIITLKGYFKDKPVTKAYLTHKPTKEKSKPVRDTNLLPLASDRDNSEVNILVDLESGRHVALTFFKMKVELEDILNQKVDLVSSGGFSQLVLKTATRSERLIYAKAG